MAELDQLDIYDDLDDFQEAQDKKCKEVQDVEDKLQEALRTIDQLKSENKQLSKKVKTMETNFQSLLDTAKAEIRRKDQLIAQLRKEKDDICFRRTNPQRNNGQQQQQYQQPQQQYQQQQPRQASHNPFQCSIKKSTETENRTLNEKVSSVEMDKNDAVARQNMRSRSREKPRDKAVSRINDELDKNVRSSSEKHRDKAVSRINDELDNNVRSMSREKHLDRAVSHINDELDRNVRSRSREKHRDRAVSRINDELDKNVRSRSREKHRDRAASRINDELDKNVRSSSREKPRDRAVSRIEEIERTREHHRSSSRDYSNGRSRRMSRERNPKKSPEIPKEQKSRPVERLNKRHEEYRSRGDSHLNQRSSTDAEDKKSIGLKRERSKERNNCDSRTRSNQDSKRLKKEEKHKDEPPKSNENATKVISLGQKECSNKIVVSKSEEVNPQEHDESSHNLVLDKQEEEAKKPIKETLEYNPVIQTDNKESLATGHKKNFLVDDCLYVFTDTDISDDDSPDETPIKDKAASIIKQMYDDFIDTDDTTETIGKPIMPTAENIESKENKKFDEIVKTSNSSNHSTEMVDFKDDEVEINGKSPTLTSKIDTNEEDVKKPLDEFIQSIFDGAKHIYQPIEPCSNMNILFDTKKEEEPQEADNSDISKKKCIESKECNKKEEEILQVPGNDIKISQNMDGEGNLGKPVANEIETNENADNNVGDIPESKIEKSEKTISISTTDEFANRVQEEPEEQKENNLSLIKNENANSVLIQEIVLIEETNSKANVTDVKKMFGNYKIPKKNSPQSLQWGSYKIPNKVNTELEKPTEQLESKTSNKNREHLIDDANETDTNSIKSVIIETEIHTNTDESTPKSQSLDNERTLHNSSTISLVEEIFDKSADENIKLPAQPQSIGKDNPCEGHEIEHDMHNIFESPIKNKSPEIMNIVRTLEYSNLNPSNSDNTTKNVPLQTTDNLNISTNLDVSIPSACTPTTDTSILNSSTEMKRLSMGSSNYVVQQVSANVVNIHITRQKNKKRRKKIVQAEAIVL